MQGHMNELPPVPQLNSDNSGVGTTQTPPVPDKFPVGLILVVILAGMGMIGGLYSLINPRLVVGIWFVSGAPALLYAVIYEAAMVALFVWLIQRKEKGRILGIIISAYNMVYIGSAFLSTVIWPDEVAGAMDRLSPGYSQMVPARFVAVMYGLIALLTWTVGAAVILYLVRRKHYFHS